MQQKQTPSALDRLKELLARAGFDWFLGALIGMILLAYLWPAPGVQEGPLSLGELANYGVSLIFFFYGLRLSPEKLQAGLSSWRLHLVVQFSTFLLFPLLALPWHALFKGGSNELLWLGTFYLAALPSTVSSSVVMVSIAGGNIPAAIFNASISSLIGIFVTPLWMGLFLSASTEGFDIWQVMGKLVLQVLLPVVLGIVLHRYWGAFAEKHRQKLRYFDQSIILLIVYTSFCESFARNMFRGYSIPDLLLLGLTMICLFFLVYGIIHLISRMLGFKREDRITALFCGSKKSLVHGTVMSKVLFPDANMVGIMLLPIMIYHALQLLAASVIAQSMARKAGVAAEGE
ncbi:bile acid:sodium symporter family protein [Pontibacter ruber]|uniref:Bile acid:sodium symporter family protein n=1 Tax=Pontibacter ruber TaxID=1343895 RepID=A0ABW5D124_9BACT|nr:bile acid:sodium symporter family protein [Pontibacter ruber]